MLSDAEPRGANLRRGLVLIKGDKFSRRFLVYFALLVGVLAALDFITTKRALMLTPWLLLALAVAVTRASTNVRLALLAALALIAVIGWFGTFARRYYAAPHFVEPWQSLRAQVAADWRGGATVISNSGPFLLYMGYATGGPWTTRNWSPETMLYRPPAPRVYQPQFWPGPRALRSAGDFRARNHRQIFRRTYRPGTRTTRSPLRLVVRRKTCPRPRVPLEGASLPRHRTVALAHRSEEVLVCGTAATKGKDWSRRSDLNR